MAKLTPAGLNTTTVMFLKFRSPNWSLQMPIYYSTRRNNFFIFKYTIRKNEIIVIIKHLRMYTLLSGAYKHYFRKDEYCILILGLDDSGKTTFLEQTKIKFSKGKP